MCKWDFEMNLLRIPFLCCRDTHYCLSSLILSSEELIINTLLGLKLDPQAFTSGVIRGGSVRGLHLTAFILSAQCHGRMGMLYSAAPFMAKYKGNILVCFSLSVVFFSPGDERACPL